METTIEKSAFISLDIKQIYINCKTTSKLRQGEKLLILDQKSFQIDQSMVPWITRSINGDNRECVVSFIEHNIDQAKIILEHIFDSLSSNKHSALQFKKDFSNIQQIQVSLFYLEDGISMLKQTYYNDANIVSTLEFLNERRVNLLNIMNEELQSLILQS